MDSILLVTIAVLVASFTLLLHSWRFRSKKLPPGPKGYPIFGSLHLLGKLPHRDLHGLSQKYGPIMHMRLGLVPTIIVSSPSAAKLFLKTHDAVFASRPYAEVTHNMNYGQKNILFAQYGSYWRNMRKMCTLELLSTLKVNSFKSMRKEEVRLFIEDLRESYSKKNVYVNLGSKVSSVIADMTCLMVFGKRYSDKDLSESGFKEAVQEALQLAAAFNLGDFIPPISALDLQGFSRRSKCIRIVFDGFLDKIIDKHIESFKEEEDQTRDFVSVMLNLMGSQETEYQIDRSSIKAVILDMLGAGMDTSTTAIGWAIPELIKNPQVMKKLQNEIEKVVGMDRMVEESELEKLKYLYMVVKETLRLHPPAPLLAPHESVEDCYIGDEFHIPKNSRLIINAWAIGRDKSVWIEPEKFYPERFDEISVDVRGRDLELIPFGSGRRACPGIQLGLTVVCLILAQLVHCFDWELPKDMSLEKMDMTEVFGLTSPRVQELVLRPIYRLHH